MLGIERFGRALVRGVAHQLVVPEVPPRRHVDVVLGAPHHEHALDGGALCHRLVHRRLERQHLTPAEAAVGGDHRFGVAVDDALGEGLGAEAAENHRVGGADAGTGQHRHRRLRDHRQVDGNAVTFADPLALQHVGELADLAQHVVVGQYPAVAGLALPEERHLVAEPAGDLLVEGNCRKGWSCRRRTTSRTAHSTRAPRASARTSEVRWQRLPRSYQDRRATARRAADTVRHC